jgi:hypothetical protein
MPSGRLSRILRERAFSQPEDREMSEPYDIDVFEWSRQQAALLRRRASGELVNEAELDWSHIAEEIESVGASELRAVRSLLVQALLHDLKAQAWPASSYVSSWRAESRRFRGDAADACTPSMRRHIDVQDLYRRALAAMPDQIEGQPPLPVPPSCTVELDELLRMA